MRWLFALLLTAATLVVAGIGPIGAAGCPLRGRREHRHRGHGRQRRDHAPHPLRCRRGRSPKACSPMRRGTAITRRSRSTSATSRRGRPNLSGPGADPAAVSDLRFSQHRISSRDNGPQNSDACPLCLARRAIPPGTLSALSCLRQPWPSSASEPPPPWRQRGIPREAERAQPRGLRRHGRRVGLVVGHRLLGVLRALQFREFRICTGFGLVGHVISLRRLPELVRKLLRGIGPRVKSQRRCRADYSGLSPAAFATVAVSSTLALR